MSYICKKIFVEKTHKNTKKIEKYIANKCG